MICYCSHCSASYEIPEDKLGKTFKCTKCGNNFVAVKNLKTAIETPPKKINYLREITTWWLFFFSIIIVISGVFWALIENGIDPLLIKITWGILSAAVIIIFVIKWVLLFIGWLKTDSIE